MYIGETKRNLPTRLKEHRAHGRIEDFEKSSIVKHSHIKDHQIDWQAAQLITPIDAWHPRRIREAIEIVKHDTVPQDIGFFISDIRRPILQTEGSSISKVHNPHQTEGSPISQVNHPSPPVLVNNWFSSGSTHSSPPTTRILVSQFPPARLNELILHSRDDPPAVYLSCSISQSPAFSWGRSELTDRNVELYPQFFLELITTQLRFYMVSPQSWSF